jgi:Ca2+-binding EF-hand superfamily protein
MDPNGKGEIVFKDVFKNTIAINDLKKEFRKADKKGRGFITLKEIN